MKHTTLGRFCGVSLGLWGLTGGLRPAAMALAVLVSVCLGPAEAAPITATQAVATVTAWLKADGNPLEAGLSQNIADVMAYPGADGITNAFYVVSLRPVGYVIVAADNLAGAVISFSSKGSFNPSPNSSLYHMLQADLPQRVAMAKATAAAPVARPQSLLAQAAQAPAPGKGAGPTPHPMDVVHPPGVDGVCRVRVAPLIASHWAQFAPYNSYTPSNLNVGVAAVCVAEIIRQAQWPKNGIGRALYLDYVNESPQWWWTGGGDGNGGPYQWTNMVDDATAAGVTPAQQQAVARLCADVGVAVTREHYDQRHGTDSYSTMPWGNLPDGTPWNMAEGLQNIFGFATGGFLNDYAGDDPIWWGDEALRHAPDEGGSLSMINANLDAGFPVLLSMWINADKGIGSTVVCDGYGYSLGGVTVDDVTAKFGMYHHINLAEGNPGEDIWYTLPVVQAGGFTNIFRVGFNIMATNTGEIVSGRIVDQDKISMPGITLQITDGVAYTNTAVTRYAGIYSFIVPPNATYTVSVVTNVGGPVIWPVGPSFHTVHVGKSTMWGACGNVWGVNFEVTSHLVGGQVIKNGVPLIGAQVAFSNIMVDPLNPLLLITNSLVTMATDWNGNFVLPVPNHWTGVVTPILPGMGGSFTPPNSNLVDRTANNTNMLFAWNAPAFFAISGTVFRADTLGNVINASITFTGSGASLGANQTVTTDPNGDYFVYLPTNWSGTVTPAHPDGGVFSPASNAYVNLASNIGFQSYFWAPPVTNTISGTVIRRDTGAPVAGAQLMTSDSALYTTDVNGNYTMPVPYQWTGNVGLSDPFGGVFLPAGRGYAAVATPLAGQNYLWTPPLPLITGMVTSANAPYGPVSNVTIALSGNAGTTVTAADGSYRLHAPFFGWIGTATPTNAAGGVFAPIQMPAINTSTNFIFIQNYVWTPPTAPTMYAISGGVWRADTLANVINAVITATGIGAFAGVNATVTTDSQGNYVAYLPANWTGTVTPAHPDLGIFSPLNRTNTLTANIGFQTYLWMPPLTNTISGTIIRRDNGDPVVGVTLTAGDGRTVTTDTNGVYLLDHVPYQWTGSLVPSHPLGGIFVPGFLSYSDVRASSGSQNYQWMPPPPVITGVVTRTDYPYGPASGVTITLSSSAGTTVTAADGSYRLSVARGWNGIITPSHAVGGIFTPSNSPAIDAANNFTIQQDFQWFPPPMTISGLVTRADDGTPVSNVVSLTFANAKNASAFAPVLTLSPLVVHTDTNGAYSFSVPFGWSGTAVPAHPFAGQFTPGTNVYTALSASRLSDNYVWTPPPPSILGRVLRFDTGVPVTNVSLIFSNDASLVLLGATNPLVVVVTDSNGNYRVPVGGGWTGTVTPVITQYTGAVFAPRHHDFTNVQADVTDTNSTQFILHPPPALFLTQATPSSRGTVAGASNGWYTVGASLSVTAMPTTVSRFAKWQDGVSNAARTIVLAPGTNTYVANFVDLGPTLVFGGLDASGGLNFGSLLVGLHTSRTITVKNTGTSICNVLGTATPREPSGAFVAVPNAYTLNPGASRSLTITFTPPVAATLTGVVTWATLPEPAAGAPTLAVQGAGLQFVDEISVSGNANFGTMLVGQKATRSLIISNHYDRALSLSGRWSNGSGFTVSGLPVTIPAGGARMITISFAATAIKDYGGAVLNISAAGVPSYGYLVTPVTVVANVSGTWITTLNKQNYTLYLRQVTNVVNVVDGVLVCKQNLAIHDQYVAGITIGVLTGVVFNATNNVGNIMLTAKSATSMAGTLTRDGVGLGAQACTWTRSSATVPSSVVFQPRPALLVKPGVVSMLLTTAKPAPAALRLTLLDLVPAALLPEDAELVVVSWQDGRPVAVSPALARYNLDWLLQTRLEASGADANTNGLPDLLETALGVPLQDGMELLIVRKQDGFAVPDVPYRGITVEGAAVPIGALPATWTLTPVQR